MQMSKRLKLYREAHGLTQADMASLIGCSSASISVWERDGAMLGVSVLALETVLTIDDPSVVLEKVRQGAGTAIEQELARATAENAALRLSLHNAHAREEKVKQWISQSPI